MYKNEEIELYCNIPEPIEGIYFLESSSPMANKFIDKLTDSEYRYNSRVYFIGIEDKEAYRFVNDVSRLQAILICDAEEEGLDGHELIREKDIFFFEDFQSCVIFDRILEGVDWEYERDMWMSVYCSSIFKIVQIAMYEEKDSIIVKVKRKCCSLFRDKSFRFFLIRIYIAYLDIWYKLKEIIKGEDYEV